MELTTKNTLLWLPGVTNPELIGNVSSFVSKGSKDNVVVDGMQWRKLTPIECERLQGLSDNYTEGVSNSQRYKMIGNGWQCDTIEHILKFFTDKGVANEN